jgi:uncharacterized membrane protein YkvA (DUF1232 family)
MRDKRTPWYVKALVILVLAYIVSPIDIIPDFIPVIGLLDEAILVPIALFFIFKLIPDDVKKESLSDEIDNKSQKKLVIIGIIIVVLIWLIFLSMLYYFYPA